MTVVAYEYVSITPLLHVGDWCPFDAVHCHGPRLASRLVQQGHAVLVKDVEIAKQVMALLDMSDEEIEKRLRVVGLWGC